MLIDTREAWLNAMTDLLRPDFEEIAPLPDNVRMTCGFPSRGGRPGKKQALGECWPSGQSEDGHFEVFITPMRHDPVTVAGILVHELVHTAVGCEEGHRGEFRSVAIAIGLEGKMTETHVGEGLKSILQDHVDRLGPYPHASLSLTEKPPQSTRMKKITCPSCDYLVRTSQKWLDIGVPTCPCGTEMKAEVETEVEVDEADD